MQTPVLDLFIKGWIGMFAHSPKTRLAWTTQTGLPSPTYSATRWWSKFEVIQKVHDSFGDVVTFLSCQDLPSVSSGKLREILRNPPQCRKLKIELAITVDSMAPFVRSTYNLEGDGILALSAYREICQLQASIACEHYPNVNAVAKAESGGSATHEQQLLQYAKACAKPAYQYFQAKFDSTTGELRTCVLAFKAARYFSPFHFYELKPTVSDLDSLSIYPFIDDNLLRNLKAELPAYQAAVEDVSADISVAEWWKNHEHELPSWSRACGLIMLVQPSSAAAERVFSLLQAFSTQQQSSLEDYVSASVMLQYNNR